jgi:hypothetical protein
MNILSVPKHLANCHGHEGNRSPLRPAALAQNHPNLFLKRPGKAIHNTNVGPSIKSMQDFTIVSSSFCQSFCSKKFFETQHRLLLVFFVIAKRWVANCGGGPALLNYFPLLPCFIDLDEITALCTVIRIESLKNYFPLVGDSKNNLWLLSSKYHYCLVSLMWMKIGSNDITAQVPGVS